MIAKGLIRGAVESAVEHKYVGKIAENRDKIMAEIAKEADPIDKYALATILEYHLRKGVPEELDIPIFCKEMLGALGDLKSSDDPNERAMYESTERLSRVLEIGYRSRMLGKFAEITRRHGAYAGAGDYVAAKIEKRKGGSEAGDTGPEPQPTDQPMQPRRDYAKEVADENNSISSRQRLQGRTARVCVFDKAVPADRVQEAILKAVENQGYRPRISNANGREEIQLFGTRFFSSKKRPEGYVHYELKDGECKFFQIREYSLF